MKLVAKTQDIRAAEKRMRIELVEAQTEFNFLTVVAEENYGAIFSTDGVSYIESRFPADVLEPGEFKIGRNLGQLLANVRDETLELDTTKTKLALAGDFGFKGRLQMMTGPDVPRAIMLERRSNTLIDIDLVILRADMSALISLCKLFPKSGSSAPWVTMTIAKNKVFGSTPGSEEGSVEELPFSVVRLDMSTDDPLTIKVFTPRLEKFVSLCTEEINLQATISPSFPLIIRDPHNTMWWALTGRTTE